jgi:hypothetical protein
MSWLFSRALVEEYSEAICSDGEQSVPLNGSNTPQAYCAPDKMTGFSRLSRFGMTYKPLTESRGEELLMSYLAAFHAKTSQPRGGGGIDGERSGMWREMARIIHEVQPGFVFVENSPMLTSRGLGRVLGDLAKMGFDAKWGVLGGEDVGAVHRRDRIWIVASNDSQIRLKCDIKKQIPKFTPFPWGKDVRGIEDLRNRSDLSPSIIWRKDYGVADYVDRVSAIGNGQIPRVAATAWTILSERI